MSLAVVCWRWSDKYTPAHVNNLYHAVQRNLQVPFEFFCLTDDDYGFERKIHTVLLPTQLGKFHARRLWIFSDESHRIFGDRILQLDLDIVITSDITDLISTSSDPIKIWKYPMTTRFGYGLNPSFLLFTPSTEYAQMWYALEAAPDALIDHMNRSGWSASDQAVISWRFSHITGPRSAEPTIPVWTDQDGIMCLKDILQNGTNGHVLPPTCRIVSFHGRFDPSQFLHLPWVHTHWLGEISS